MSNANLRLLAPDWLEDSAQGLAYWIGYSSVRDATPAPELALGHELARLIGSKAKQYEVSTESPYGRMKTFESAAIAPRAKADITIWANIRGRRPVPALELKCVIEIKRGKASSSKIQDDFRRLAAVAEELQGVRAFLVLVSEGGLPPKPFATSNGLKYRARVHPIEETRSEYIVTGVYKAAPAFQHPDAAHYVCVAEVSRRPEFNAHV